jgi:hypothetical protein
LPDAIATYRTVASFGNSLRTFGLIRTISKKGNKRETQMTPATLASPKKESPLLFEGLTWREFKAVEQLLDRPGYRLSFLDGVLEIRKMPGEPHETVKKRIAALLEIFLMMAGFDFTPTGSMTLENEAVNN